MMIVVFVSLDVISFSVTSISYRGEPSSIYSVHEVEYWQHVNEIQKPAVSATYEEFDVQKLSILLPELQQELPAGAVAHFLRSSQQLQRQRTKSCHNPQASASENPKL